MNRFKKNSGTFLSISAVILTMDRRLLEVDTGTDVELVYCLDRLPRELRPGDTAELMVRQGRTRKEGFVKRIIKTRKSLYTGIVTGNKKEIFIIPADHSLRHLRLQKSDVRNLRINDKVVFRLKKAGLGQEAAVSQVLGRGMTYETELKALYIEKDVRKDFPLAVLTEADAYRETNDRGAFRDRLDLTDDFIITIDSEDARDHDDAVSIRKDGNVYTLGVHIADVSHFVRQNSALDREAQKRGTSTYLPEEVIPMLPPALSNNLCSLKENRLRPALSAFIEIGPSGNIIKSTFKKSLLKISKRLSYNQVNGYFGDNKLGFSEIGGNFKDLLVMKELSDILREKRKRRGTVYFDLPEIKFKYDGQGRIIDWLTIMGTPSAALIEEFMITANEAVAGLLFKNRIPAIYRTHARPDEERFTELLDFLRYSGINVKKGNPGDPSYLQSIIAQVQDKANSRIYFKKYLKTLSRAIYSDNNTGHFGLQSESYTHFTSPIRRYPDLIVHRLLKSHIEGGRTPVYSLKELRLISKVSSLLEKKADDLERCAVKLKMMDIIRAEGREIFEGLVTETMFSGLFVEIVQGVEGFIQARTLPKSYRFNERPPRFTTKRESQALAPGARVKVKLKRLNLSDRKIDLQLTGV